MQQDDESKGEEGEVDEDIKHEGAVDAEDGPA